MTFSIIVVCLNAGEKLRVTIESILNQTERDYEIIIKDGGSADEATQTYLNKYRQEKHVDSEQDEIFAQQVRVYTGRDAGIYDAMNQAMQYVRGDYVFFLNCGDRFYNNEVLMQVKEQILRTEKQDDKDVHRQVEVITPKYIFYGNVYELKTSALVQSNPIIDDFACYRNIPCHQACFYNVSLLREKSFDISYAVRADYEHFLWCYYKACAVTVYMPITVSFYEGGGFSETRENERKSRREHREIVNKYMPGDKVRRYRWIMLLTLAPVRTWIARNPVTAGIYQQIKRKLYKRQ